MSNVFANRVLVATATTGTGTVTLGAALAGYRNFASAGIANAAVVRYLIVDGNAWEIGTGTYTASGTTLSRTAQESSAGGTTALNLTGGARVAVIAAAQDYAAFVKGPASATNDHLALFDGTTGKLIKGGGIRGTAANATVVTSDTDVTAGRLLTTVAGPAQAFRRGNVIGTVSESGGVPTGALIQRGSNANGEFARFADGTQLCQTVAFSIDVTTAAGNVFRGVGSAVTFPSAFVATPAIAVYLNSTGNNTVWTGTYSNQSATGFTPRAFAFQSTSAVSFSAIAIGRWF